MNIDLAEVARVAGARATHDFCTDVPGDEQAEIIGPVCGTLTVANMGRLLMLRGNFRAQVRLQCSRCLEPVTHAVQGMLQEEFASETPGVERPRGTIDQDEPKEAAYSEGMLDLTELLRQQVLLSLPLRPVCGPDCRGLCPTCGQNLNLGACSCPKPGPRGPLSDLARIIEQKRGSHG